MITNIKSQIVMSPGGHLDEDHIFTHILEKLGWKRRGYVGIYKTSHYKTCGNLA
jgi:hypothetical protein